MNGRELKRFREQKGLSQHALAKLASVSRSKISLFECEYAVLVAGDQQKLMRALSQYKERTAL